MAFGTGSFGFFSAGLGGPPPPGTGGIYGGSGSVPTSVVATLTDNFTIASPDVYATYGGFYFQPAKTYTGVADDYAFIDYGARGWLWHYRANETFGFGSHTGNTTNQFIFNRGSLTNGFDVTAAVTIHGGSATPNVSALHIIGSGSTNGTSSIRVENSSLDPLFTLYDDGIFAIGLDASVNTGLGCCPGRQVAVGANSATGSYDSVAVGSSAKANGTHNTVIGASAGATGGATHNSITLIGYNANGVGSAVCLGASATAGTNGMAIGYLAKSTGLRSTRIGYSYSTDPLGYMDASGQDSIAIGLSRARASGSYAIGTGETDNNVETSLAIGWSGTTDIFLSSQSAGTPVDSFFNLSDGVVFGGTSVDVSAVLQTDSSTKGFLPPRNTDPDTNIPTPADGLIAYDSTDNKLQYYDSASWITLGATELLVANTLYVDGTNGDDDTAVSGDMSKPYATITGLAGANASAVVGDLIHIRPGTYQENDIIKDGVAYYFDKGAIIHPLEALQVADDKAIIDIVSHTNKANILGYGEFISDNGTYTGTNVGCMYVDTDEAHIEFYLAYMRDSTASGGPRATVIIQQTGTEDQEIFVRGTIKKDNSLGGVPQNAMIVRGGNTRFEGKIIQNGTGTAGQGLYINVDSADFRGTGDIYCDGDTADSYAFRTSSRGRTLWYGNIVAGNQATCYAYMTDSNYTGDSAIFGKFEGAIILSLGGLEGRGSYISGIQLCSGSPNGFAITCDDGCYNVVDLVIASYVKVFSISEGAILFQGVATIHSDNQAFLTQTGGKFMFEGMMENIARRLTNSTITGGECIIESDFVHWGSNYPSNEYLFHLDGGTLRIESCRLENNQTTSGSGVIEYVSGNLILNGAVLVSTAVDVTTFSIKVVGALNYIGYNDSYANMAVGGGGSLTNLITGGGSIVVDTDVQ